MWEVGVPTTPCLDDGVFDSEAIQVMGHAFVDACCKLGLSEASDQAAELLARKVETAERGDRDAGQLIRLVLKYSATERAIKGVAEGANRRSDGTVGQMLLDHVKCRLRATGFNLVDEARDGNDVGWRLRLECNALVNVYDTGRLTVQGRKAVPVRRALGEYYASHSAAGRQRRTAPTLP